MRKFFKCFGLIFFILLVCFTVWRLIDYYSKASKNTRAIERTFSQGITESGAVKELIQLEYDKMYVFEPYQLKKDMEKKIGFSFFKLKQSVDESMVNILLVKGNSVIAYLYGYPDNLGFDIDIPSGEYTKVHIDSMAYTMEVIEYVNNNGKTKSYKKYRLTRDID